MNVYCDASLIVSVLATKVYTADARCRAWRPMSDGLAVSDWVAALDDAGQRGLRAADALHLAIAERHGLAMATLDADLADTAQAIGLDVPPVRRPS